MKKFKKIFNVSLCLVIMFVLIGCEPTEKPKIPNDVNLPTVVKKEAIDEVIYISLNTDGEVNNLKAVSRVSDTEFAYYKVFGKFAKLGTNNLSNGAEIIFEDKYIKVPSLGTDDNLFFELSLDKSYYDLLPFNISTKFYLNDEITKPELLLNKSGDITIKIIVEPNDNTSLYLKNYYGAQIQVPIDITNNIIKSTKGALQTTVTGKTATVVYSVLPNTSAEFEIKLRSKHFYFSGIEAAFQEFDMLSLIDNFDLSLVDVNEINALPEAIEFINGMAFEPYLDNTNMFFSKLTDMFSQLSVMTEEKDQINQLEELKLLGFLLPIFSNSIDLLDPTHEDYETHLIELTNLVKNISEASDNINLAADNLLLSFNSIDEKLIYYYQLFYHFKTSHNLVNEVVSDLINMKEMFNELEQVLSEDVLVLLVNSQEILQITKEIKHLNANIQINMNTAINDLYYLSEFMLPFFNDLIFLVESLNNFLTSLTALDEAFIDYDMYLKTNINEYFIQTPESLETLYTLIGLLEGVEEEPGLIDQLTNAKLMLVDVLMPFDESIDELLFLITPDAETNIMPFSLIGSSLLEINYQLSTPLEQNLSFYNGIAVLTEQISLLEKVLEILPSKDIQIESFLDKNNNVVGNIQFIIKQDAIK